MWIYPADGYVNRRWDYRETELVISLLAQPFTLFHSHVFSLFLEKIFNKSSLFLFGGQRIKLLEQFIPFLISLQNVIKNFFSSSLSHLPAPSMSFHKNPRTSHTTKKN